MLREPTILDVPQTELQGVAQPFADVTNNREERDALGLPQRGMPSPSQPLIKGSKRYSAHKFARLDPDRLRAREADCAASEDLREGQAALAQKRPPVFRGR